LNIIQMPMDKIPLDQVDIGTSAEVGFYENRIKFQQARKNLERQQLLPDIGFEYFQGTSPGLNGNLSGYQIGLKIPLIFIGQSSRIKAARIAEEIAVEESTAYENSLRARLQELTARHTANTKALEYYEQEGTELSEEILKTATSSFRNGEIDFFQYIQSIENAYEIKLEYLENLNRYNQTVIALNHLTF
ncbi:MAG: TolC family protein, partial [Eudoraea sp.]|nr:TolC family protein [Eudoraea sp.]